MNQSFLRNDVIKAFSFYVTYSCQCVNAKCGIMAAAYAFKITLMLRKNITKTFHANAASFSYSSRKEKFNRKYFLQTKNGSVFFSVDHIFSKTSYH